MSQRALKSTRSSPRMRQQGQSGSRMQPPQRPHRHIAMRRTPRHFVCRAWRNAPGLGCQGENMAGLGRRGNVVGAQWHGNGRKKTSANSAQCHCFSKDGFQVT